MPADRTHVPKSAIKNKNNFLTEQEEGAQAQHPEGHVVEVEGEREVVIVWFREVTHGCPQEGGGGLVAVNKQEQKGLEA